MLRLNWQIDMDLGGRSNIQIQPMLRLNKTMDRRRHCQNAIQIQPMLRLNSPSRRPDWATANNSNTTNVKVKQFLLSCFVQIELNNSNTTNVKVKLVAGLNIL